jgi:hypothetical protein
LFIFSVSQSLKMIIWFAGWLLIWMEGEDGRRRCLLRVLAALAWDDSAECSVTGNSLLFIPLFSLVFYV